MRLLLTPRWILGHLLVLVVALTCIRLGIWQLDRLEQRRAFNALLTERLAMPPAPLEDLLSQVGPDADALAYRRTVVEGTYDPDGEVILFGRTLDGQPGNHLLTPLETNGERALVVDRGWVPLELQDPPVAEAAPPPGRVTLTGILFPPEETGGSEGGGAPVETFGEIDLRRIGRQLGAPVEPSYLWLLDQEPAQPGALPRRVPLPERGEGPHLSYAVQWFVFATIALIGWIVLIRKELRRRRTIREDPPAPAPQSL